LGLPQDLAVADGGGSKAARSAGAATVKAACGIAGFLAVYLTDMMGIPNRSDKESHSTAAARSAPLLQRRGGSIGADEDLVDKI